MVRVPGSIGDSGFHRDSQEDVQVKVEQGEQASSDLGSTMMPLNESISRALGGTLLMEERMKAPEMDDDDQIGSKPRSRSGQCWSDEDLENLFYHKELREFLDRDPVMRILRLKQVIQTATKDLFSKLKILVGEIPQITDPVPSPPASITDRQTSSSHYASAAEDESYLSSEPKRMSLGPS
ncbi:Hypothetical protein PHPALM_11280, partial [Phytophthora palmivora]